MNNGTDRERPLQTNLEIITNLIFLADAHAADPDRVRDFMKMARQVMEELSTQIFAKHRA